MSPSPAMLQELLASSWVHAFEHDTNGDEVYCRAGEPIPPARRPRERIALRADGTATVGIGGPDDRSRQIAATWQIESDEIVVRTVAPADTRSTYRIVSIAADRLRVRVS